MFKKIVILSVILMSGVGSVAFAETQLNCTFASTQNKRIPEEIKVMQKVLNAEVDTRISAVGAGSPGMEVSNYGPKMKKALTVFQKKHGLVSKPYGLLNQVTIAKLSTECTRLFSVKAEALKQPTVVLDSVTTPPRIPGGALWIPFTGFNISAGDSEITIESFTVEQKGFSSIGIFEGIVVMDEEGEVLGEAKINSNRLAVVKVDPITIAKGESVKLVLGGSTGEVVDFDGQLVQLALVSMQSSTPVSGMPVLGNSSVIVGNYSIGSALAYRGYDDPAFARKRYINDTNITFSGIKLTASSVEPVELHSIAFVQSGSASGDDIQNVRIVVNGMEYPAEVDGREYALSLPSPVKIDKGNSMDISIKGDMGITGSNRTVRFDIPAPDEIAIFGTQSKFFLEVGVGGNASLHDESSFITTDGTEDGDSVVPMFYKGSTVTISAGEMTSIGR
jgi:hypothetical protein